MKIRKLSSDMMLNFVSAVIPLITLQFLIYPLIGNKYGQNTLGTAIVSVGILVTISFSLGNVLNNVKLLQNVKYSNTDENSDFTVLVIGGAFINLIAIFVLIYVLDIELGMLNIIIIFFVSIFYFLREYFIVYYRIILDYKMILLNNLILSLGYLFGLFVVVFFFNDKWTLIFFFGYSFSLIFILLTIKPMPICRPKSRNFKDTFTKSLKLGFSGVIKSSVSQIDKLILFPLVGPAAVSIYFSASFIGKTMMIAVTPSSSVILSYLTKDENSDKINFNKKYILFLLLLVPIGYFLLIFVSKPIILFMYPGWGEESVKLIFVTSAIAITSVISTLLNPFILRFKNLNWQIILNSVNILFYLTFSLLLFSKYDLLGFSIGIFIAALLKLTIQLKLLLNKKT